MRRRRSGGFDRNRLDLGAHLAAQQIKEHDDAVLVAQLDEPPDHVFERAGADPHELAELRQPAPDPATPRRGLFPAAMVLKKTGEQVDRQGQHHGVEQEGQDAVRQHQAPP